MKHEEPTASTQPFPAYFASWGVLDTVCCWAWMQDEILRRMQSKELLSGDLISDHWGISCSIGTPTSCTDEILCGARAPSSYKSRQGSLNKALSVLLPNSLAVSQGECHKLNFMTEGFCQKMNFMPFPGWLWTHSWGCQRANLSLLICSPS